MAHDTIQEWHHLIAENDFAGLDNILADEVVFHSPIVHTPQEGKEITKLYLTAAFFVFQGESFRYVREIITGSEAVLEFTTEIEGIYVNGVDMIRWNEDGQIVNFKVMIRPLKAINLIHRLMQEMLAGGMG